MLRKIIAASIFLSASTCYSVKLHEALESGYQHNNEYKNSVDDFKTTIESFPQALGALLPSIKGSISYSKDKIIESDPDLNDKERIRAQTLTKNLELRQNIFNGGADSAALQIAKYSFIMAKAQFEQSERKFLLNAVQNYLTAIEATENLRRQKKNLNFFAKKLSSAKDKFNVGQATKTDIAQAEAEYAKAIGTEASLVAQKIQADLGFRQFFGIAPKDLEWPATPDNLPKSLEDFKKIVTTVSPELKASKAQFKASKAGVVQATSALLPKLHFVVGYVETDFPSKPPLGSSYPDQKNRDFTTALTLDIPIFTNGGAEYSKVRAQKAKSRHSASDLDEAQKTLETTIQFQWENLHASKKQYQSASDTLKAYQMVLDGTEKEETFGNKSILDVLSAKKDLSDAETNHVAAKKAYVLVSYNIQLLIGNLNAKKLKLNIKPFDPDKEFKKVQFKLIGF